MLSLQADGAEENCCSQASAGRCNLRSHADQGISGVTEAEQVPQAASWAQAGSGRPLPRVITVPYLATPELSPWMASLNSESWWPQLYETGAEGYAMLLYVHVPPQAHPHGMVSLWV